jgi:PPOX class probable F420-dependent enzyme
MDTFAAVSRHQYINLMTFRSSGETIATTVWFVHNNHHIYVRTGYNAGKVKRIRRNPHVIVEPCNRQGIALGPQISADARICAPSDYERINTLLNQKYGVMKRFIDVLTRLRGGSNTYDVIEITGSPDVRA